MVLGPEYLQNISITEVSLCRQETAQHMLSHDEIKSNEQKDGKIKSFEKDGNHNPATKRLNFFIHLRIFTQRVIQKTKGNQKR